MVNEEAGDFSYKLEDVSPTKKELTVEVSADEISTVLEKSYRTFQKKVKLPGFRAGKVPIRMVRQRFGRDVEEDLVQRLLPSYFDKAVTKAKIQPVDLPVIRSVHLKEGDPFHFEATVYVLPEFDVRDYLGIPVPDRKVEEADGVVKRVLETMRDGHAELSSYEDETHAAAKGDVVEADFEGTIDGEPFPGGKVENHLLELGTGKMIPGFEEGIIGMKKGEEKELTLTFPEDYGEEKISGKEAVFKIAVKDIKEKRLPELDDEFAKDMGEEFETLDELKEKIREKYREQEEMKRKEDLRKNLKEEIIRRNPVEVPEVMVARQKHSLMERFGLLEGTSEPDLEPEKDMWLEKQALQDVTWSLISEKIAEKEGITLSEAEMEAALEEEAMKNSMTKEALLEFYNIKMGSIEPLRMGLLDEKVLDFLLENAKVTDKGSPEEKE
ncbi:MAG: trigger factor [Deltaproteobacteria bacterium]|nr:trigger factor [Deltaproteobacteria bacterium]